MARSRVLNTETMSLVQQLQEASRLEEEIAEVFFHGCPKEEAAQLILREGIKPRDATLLKRGMLTPVAGKAYLTGSLQYAIIYALGGDIAGHTMPPGRGFDGYGYVFQVANPNHERLTPDEDCVGEVAYTYHHQKPSEFDSEFSRNLKSDPQFLNYAGRWISSQMTPTQVRRAKDGETMYMAAGGKRALKSMPPDMKRRLLELGAHAAHEGPIPIVRAWRIDKSKSALIKRDGSNFFDIAEPVPIPQGNLHESYEPQVELLQKLLDYGSSASSQSRTPFSVLSRTAHKTRMKMGVEQGIPGGNLQYGYYTLSRPADQVADPGMYTEGSFLFTSSPLSIETIISKQAVPLFDFGAQVAKLLFAGAEIEKGHTTYRVTPSLRSKGGLQLTKFVMGNPTGHVTLGSDYTLWDSDMQELVGGTVFDERNS